MAVNLRKPVLRVMGPTGVDLVPRWDDQLLGIEITDNEGYESDQLVVRLAGNPPFDRAPPPKTPYLVYAGYEGAGVTLMGRYEYQTFRKSGDPEGGHELHIICRAADFIDKMKDAGSAHFDKENGFGTAGKIFEHLASRAGIAARIDPDIAKIEIPYRLQHRQSAIDFATDLADEIGAIIKPQMGYLVVRKRGAGTSASGNDLPTLNIPFDPSYGYEVELEPRSGYQQVDAQRFDPKTGRPEESPSRPGFPAARMAVQHPLASKIEAEQAAKAVGKEYGRFTGTGSFEMAGTPLAIGGAPAKCTGFGSDIDPIKWEVSSASHSIEPGEGWIVNVEVQTQETGKLGSSATQSNPTEAGPPISEFKQLRTLEGQTQVQGS